MTSCIIAAMKAVPAVAMSRNLPRAPIGYPVRGELSTDGRQIKLHGKTPQADAQCQIVDQRDREITLVYRGPRERRCEQSGRDVITCR